jgi:hypothetical protein
MSKIQKVTVVTCFLFWTIVGIAFIPPAWAEEDSVWNLPFRFHGFWEIAGGLRCGDSRTEHEDYDLLESRFQLKFTYYPEIIPILADWNSSIFFKADFLVDGFDEEPDGELREFYLETSPLSFFDVKVGRYIITWGTGDLVFINDLFPKDWVSFFIGRDDQYLKVPSDALKTSFFSPWVNLDVIFIPFFEPDNPIRGKRLSFFNPFTNKLVGEDAHFYYQRPDRNPESPEFAARLNRFFGSYETALYGFWGYYKQPAGIKEPLGQRFFYPRLNVYGASIRGPAVDGIIHLELGYYLSKEDQSGNDPLIENSSMKYLVGYEREFWTDFTLGAQYFLNQLLDYADYRSSTPSQSPRRDHYMHLLTLRLTQLLYHQDIELSFFAFYSPSDQDFHLRPRISYEMSDNWKISLGSNIFGGRDDFTLFGQLKRNDNVYLRIRYSF